MLFYQQSRKQHVEETPAPVRILIGSKHLHHHPKRRHIGRSNYSLAQALVILSSSILAMLAINIIDKVTDKHRTARIGAFDLECYCFTG